MVREDFHIVLLWQVQAHIVKLRRQLSMIDGLPPQSKAASGQWFFLEFSYRLLSGYHITNSSDDSDVMY